ncbi:MAG: insulinase family protein [Polyangiaceae bacterium]
MRRTVFGLLLAALLAQGCREGASPVEPHAPRPFPTPAGAEVPKKRPTTPILPTFVGVPERATLPNGVRVVVYTDASLPLVSVAFVVDHPGVAGDAYLTRWYFSRAVLGAHDGESREEAFGTLAYLAVRPVAHTRREGIAWTFDTLEPLWASGFREVAAMLSTPELSRADMNETTAQCQREHAVPGHQLDMMLRRSVYGSVHPLVAPEYMSCLAMSRETLLAYRDHVLAPSTLSVVVAGDVSLAEVVAVAKDAFTGFADHGKKAPYAAPKAPEAAPPTFERAVLEGAVDVKVAMAFPGATTRSADRAPLEVLAWALGASLTGSLDSKLRNEQGATYGFQAHASSSRIDGTFFVGGSIARENASATLGSLDALLRQAGTRLLSPAELARAKKAALVSISRTYETPHTAALALVDLVLEGEAHRGPLAEAILATTAEDVRRVATTYVRPELAHVVVGSDEATVHALQSPNPRAPATPAEAPKAP